MDPLTDLGVSVASEVATSGLAKIKKHAAYVYKYKKNLCALQVVRVQLDAKRADASRFSEEANSRLKDISSTVSIWQSDANDLLQKAENIISRNNNISCINMWSRYSSSKHAWELTQVINKKVENAPDFGTSFDLPITEYGDKSNLRGSIDFDSRLTILNGVLEALKDEDTSMCTICGMGGIGKTIMAKKLVQIVEADHLFKVAMVTVSQNPDLGKIQSEVIELLGLKIDESTMPGRAKKLKYWLSNNRALLILDDVWWQFHVDDFENVGIPLATKGCKIVVTSRHEDECNKMGSQRNFLLKVLKGGEARDLFIQNAGKCDGNLHDTARKIVRECDGLPIAIVTIASALNGKPKSVWDDSLRKLQKSNLQAISGMDKVYSRIQLSYDLLNDQEAQSCFRLCCLFPEDYDVPVEKLVFYGWGLELFEGVDSLEEARDRVDLIIIKLKKSFLLLDGKKDGYVKLHDIVRDFAISISSKEKYPYLVRWEKEMKKWPDKSLFEKCSAISIVCGTIKDVIPVNFRCPNLKLLQLHVEDCSGELPIGFFEGMEELRVVDLHVRSASPRLTMQKEIRTLLINNDQQDDGFKMVEPNYFREMLGEGNMKNLEIFSLSSTSLFDFPKEIGQLCNLRCLRFNVGFEYMPVGVLSKLVKLEELELPRRFINWGYIEERRNRVNASLNEIECHPLTSITISVPKGSALAEKLVQNIKRFQICFGRYRYFGVGLNQNSLWIVDVDVQDVTKNWISSLVRKCDILRLEEVRKMKYIMLQQPRGNNGFPCTYFSQLKELNIKDMDSLEEIWDIPNCPNILTSNLTNITISTCYKLKHVFPLSVFRELKQLQALEISYCREVEEIFYKDQVEDENQVQVNGSTSTQPNDHKPQLSFDTSNDSLQIVEEIVEKVDEREVDHVIVFPLLKTLRLHCLWKLKILYNGNHAIECPSLEELSIEECNNMEPLPYGSFSAPNTEELTLKGVRSFKNVINWLHLGQHNKIPQLRCLDVDGCHETKYLVVDPILLERLYINNMDSLEEIWHGPHLSNIPPPWFHNLTNITIMYCPKLKHMFPLSAATQLRQLQEVDIFDCEEIEGIFYNDQTMEEKQTDDAMDAIIFSQLRVLELSKLYKLRFFYEGNHAVEMPSLEELIIKECNKMEAISKGSIKAPKLKEIQINETKYPSGEDLNTIARETLNQDYGDTEEEAEDGDTEEEEAENGDTEEEAKDGDTEEEAEDDDNNEAKEVVEKKDKNED